MPGERDGETTERDDGRVDAGPYLGQRPRYGRRMSRSGRRAPSRGADERALLDGWLEYYRDTLRHKCAGVRPDQLAARSCPPSTMSLAGLVRHLTEMERAYVHRLAERGLPPRYVTDERPDGDFDDARSETVAEDLRIFDEHCARSRQILADRPLDDTLRWTYLYLVKEYARHLGHADLLRERIDGTVGE
jgi:hypothetical protein